LKTEAGCVIFPEKFFTGNIRIMSHSRRDFLRILSWGTAACTAPGLLGTWGCRSLDTPPPNVIIIFCDDLGYGDIGCFGHPSIRTPHIDRMAAEGQKWTSFYVAACVCTPSRAALLTGRLPIRSGMTSPVRRVLFPDSAGGLPQSEFTIAEALKAQGYATVCIGKWHLGHLPPHLPTRHGFDTYFGIPYSNDMDPVSGKGLEAFDDPRYEYWNVPLMRDEAVIERPADQNTLTRRYTEEAVRFIQDNRAAPFFLYLAHTFPHVPLFRSQEFSGASLRGLYGDVIEEIDWSTGRILDTLRRLNLAENTLVVFTSDNGPWLSYEQQGGTAGLLRGGKGTTWEGGMRVSALFWWPGRIPPGVKMDMGSTLDLLPTICRAAGAYLPPDLVLDGFDLGPTLRGEAPGPHRLMFFYREAELFAVRKGPYKAHFVTKESYVPDLQERRYDTPLLFQLEHDPSERFDLAAQYPEVIADIQAEVARHRAGLEPVEDQLAKLIPDDSPDLK